MTDAVNVPREMIDAVMKVAVGVDEYGAEVFPGPCVAAELIAAALAAAPKAEPVSDPYKLDLEALAKEAAERVHENGGCVPQLAYAPILFALQANETILRAVMNAAQPLSNPQQLPEAPKVEQDYAELKRLAENASPGPWKACGTIYEHMNCEIRTGAKGEGQPIGQIWDGPNAFADGQFIAAANPSVILDLIARASHPAPASDELIEALERIQYVTSMISGRAIDEVARREAFMIANDAIRQHEGAK